LPSGIRHIGLELRFSLRHCHAGIDVWFWREASFPLWEDIRLAPANYNAFIGEVWEFEQVEGRPRARMFINKPISEVRTESSWQELYRWLGEKLSLVYEKVIPTLREEMDRRETV
jgi:hypothetical protein